MAGLIRGAIKKAIAAQVKQEAAEAAEKAVARRVVKATPKAEKTLSVALRPKPKASAPKSSLAVDTGRKKVGSNVVEPLPEGGLAGADSPYLISTRRPSPGRNDINYELHGNPDKQILLQSPEAMRANPELFTKNMGLLAEEPFMSGAPSSRPDDLLNYGLEQGSRNLEFITNEMMDPNVVSAAQHWYPVAHDISNRASARAGMPNQAGWGVQAVFSPQTAWDINVARTDRLMDMWGDKLGVDPEDAARWVRLKREEEIRKKYKPTVLSTLGEDYARQIANMPFEEITKPLDRFARMTLADATRNDPRVPMPLLTGEYGDLGRNISWGSGDVANKAWNILSDPTMDTINEQLLGGGKVPTFYNDIAAPYSNLPMTVVDTHTAGATSFAPGGGKDPIVYRAMGLSGDRPASDVAATGAKGLYGVISGAHDIAAPRLGIDRPRGVQSVTWEGVRDLWGENSPWGERSARKALKSDIADIWRTEGRNPDLARFKIAERLGRPVRRMYQVRR